MGSMSKRADPAAGASSRIVTAASSDGAVTFTLSARPGGISVQRNEQRPGGRRLVQSMRFSNAQSFVKWCESDELRFAYPLLFSNLARSGRELFDAPG